MLSSSESDPFTTAPPPSPPLPPRSDALTLIHGFPQERHSFRNVDRVRQRFKSGSNSGKGVVQDYNVVPNGNGNVNGKKRKLESRNASGSDSATDFAVSASEMMQMWKKKGKEKEKMDDGVKPDTSTSGLPYLKTAKQMESASVGRIIPSSPTGRRDHSKNADGGTKGTKLHRRRTFAGYTQKNNLPLPHIDLISKLPRSSSVSPAVVFRKQPVVLGKDQQSISRTQQLVLHRLSRRKRHSSLGQNQGQSNLHRSSLPHSISRTLPNKTLGGPLTTTDPISNGISITQLSARSLELLIENGLSLVFKKLEMNHGFASDTVKRAWLRCNGDIEATDGLLLTMRKAAEKAEASFLNEWDESGTFVVEEEEERTSETELEEEEEERVVKRPRWSEPHISPLQSDSIDSRYVPHQLSSDRDLIYPMTMMEGEKEYSPPVGTKAEMYRRLTEQGRHDEAQKFLIYSMTPRKSGSSSNSTPREMVHLSSGGVRKLVRETNSSVGGRDKLTSGRKIVHEATLRGHDADTRRKTVSGRIGDTITTPPTETIPTTSVANTESRADTKKRKKRVSADHTEQTTITAPSLAETTPTGPISNGTNIESRNPSITHEPRHQHEDDDNGANGMDKSSGGRISLKKHHETTLRSRSGKVVDRMEKDTTTLTTGKPISSGTNTESRNPSITHEPRNQHDDDSTNALDKPYIGHISLNNFLHRLHRHKPALRASKHKTGSGEFDWLDETITTVEPSLTETIPTIGKPIRSGTNIESRNPSITHQNDDQTHHTPREKQKPQTPHNTIQPPNPTTTKSSTNKNASPNSSSDDVEPNWTPSDDEALVNSTDKIQLDKLSSKYGERNVLKRFVKLVRMKG